MFDVNDLHGEEVFVEEVADKEVNDEVQKVFEEVVEYINTAKLIVNAAQVSAAGEVIAASIETTEKGKAIMIEEPMKPKKKDQIRLDEKATLKLQAEFNEEEQRLTRERAQKDQRANIELKELMEIIPDKEEVAIDAIPFPVKSPKIVDWKIHKEGKKSYYQIIRANKNSKMYMVFNRMFKEFDREDLEDLYNLNIKFKGGLKVILMLLELILLDGVSVDGKLQWKICYVVSTAGTRVKTASEISTAGTRVKTASESYYCQYKEVTTAQVEVSVAQKLKKVY
nr:hypothetical protein [Tanacetum cinerariifolium]